MATVNYSSLFQIGLYREETGIVAGGGTITCEVPIAWNCNAFCQNEEHATETFKLGFAFIWNDTDSGYITSDVTAVSGRVATIGAGHNGDTMNVGYYAAGTGLTANTVSSYDGDYARASHPDALMRAYNSKGHVNPIDAGMVYDHVMGYKRCAVTASEATELEHDFANSNTTGTWTFTNGHPFYVTSLRVELLTSAIQTTKGIEVHIYESGGEIGYQSGASGIILNDTQNWMTSEFADGAETWYSSTIYLGMLLTDAFKVRIETYNGNTSLSSGECYLFLSGWHIPDEIATEDDDEITEDFAFKSVPAPVGLYTTDVVQAGSDRSITPTLRLCHDMDYSLRTKPHERQEYRYGIEYALNLTTNQYVTTSIWQISTDYIFFGADAVSDDDWIEIGYYAYTTALSTLSPGKGDTIRKEHVDALVRAADRVDRIDFGSHVSPYGDGANEFTWHYGQFQEVNYEVEWIQKPILGPGWQTLIQFDPVNYNSREGAMEHDYTDRDATDIDETPFFLTGFTFECNEDSVDGGLMYDNGVQFRFTFNGSNNIRQAGQTEVTYYPGATTSNFSYDPAIPGATGCYTNYSSGTTFSLIHIPFGIFRCYSVKVEARVLQGQAFKTVIKRQAYLQGWMIDDD